MLWMQIKKDIPDLLLMLVSIFTAIDSKSKGSIFNIYYDSWSSVHRYTYIIAIAREVWLNMFTCYVNETETLVFYEIFL